VHPREVDIHEPNLLPQGRLELRMRRSRHELKFVRLVDYPIGGVEGRPDRADRRERSRHIAVDDPSEKCAFEKCHGNDEIFHRRCGRPDGLKFGGRLNRRIHQRPHMIHPLEIPAGFPCSEISVHTTILANASNVHRRQCAPATSPSSADEARFACFGTTRTVYPNEPARSSTTVPEKPYPAVLGGIDPRARAVQSHSRGDPWHRIAPTSVILPHHEGVSQYTLLWDSSFDSSPSLEAEPVIRMPGSDYDVAASSLQLFRAD
jgi:hypothetical protein